MNGSPVVSTTHHDIDSAIEITDGIIVDCHRGKTDDAVTPDMDGRLSIRVTVIADIQGVLTFSGMNGEDPLYKIKAAVFEVRVGRYVYDIVSIVAFDRRSRGCTLNIEDVFSGPQIDIHYLDPIVGNTVHHGEKVHGSIDEQ